MTSILLAQINPEQIGAYSVAFIFGCMAAYEKLANRKRTIKTEKDQAMLSEALAFKERGDLMLKQAEEYRVLLEKEYQAHEVTREYHHKQATLAQQKLMECNERCLDLQHRTDLSRLEHLLVEQTAALSQIALGIQELLKR